MTGTAGSAGIVQVAGAIVEKETQTELSVQAEGL